MGASTTARGTSWIILALVLIPAIASGLGVPTGAQCSDHPLYKTAGKGEIIRSWSYRLQADGRQYWTTSVYFPRYQTHAWAPLENPTSTKYANLDYFSTHTGTENHADFVTLNFQRSAKVYLMIHAYRGTGAAPTLTGWTSEKEYIEITKGKGLRTAMDIGTCNATFGATSRAYVFSKVGTSIEIGSRAWMFANVKNLETKGSWSAMIAEADGSPVVAPTRPEGMEIPAGGRCPSELHDSWVTPSTDSEDTALGTKMFQTWHPLWDPCYWCAYDHEHGSSAPLLMNYKPKYGYTALKNNEQDESHKGFKDIVLDLGTHHMYYGLHAHMSSKSRFSTRFHTLVIAVTEKATNATVAELSFKADYGHEEVRLARGGMEPITHEDAVLKNETGRSEARKFRIINVINKKTRDPRYEYRDAPNELHGNYEQWRTVPICSYVRRGREPNVDFKDMALALNTAEDKEEVTVLGRMRDGQLHPQVSVNREFRTEDFKIADRLCKFALPDIQGRPKEGKFYTNPYGTILLDAPGPTNIAQYIRPGFNITVSGDYNAVDPWEGLYIKGAEGHMRDIACAVKAEEN